jgi:hypothetical protein
MSTTVFISSTSRDLLDHRAAVAKALLNAGFHPIDMANFMARPEGAKSACLREVSESDLFVGIYSWRYGFIPPGVEVSITEQEFIEAERLKKPCFIFIVDENHSWSEEFKEPGLGARLLREFKARLDLKLVRTTFTTPDDLAMKVLASLQRYEREHPHSKSAVDTPASPPAGPSTQIGGVNLSGISGSTLNLGNTSSNVSAGGDIIGGSKREIHTGGGAYIEGSVNTGGGDFVGRDKITTTGMPPETIAAAFVGLYEALDRLPNTLQKQMARQAIEALEAEANKGQAVDEEKVKQGFEIILAMLPDIAEVAVQTFLNPIQGLSTAFQKIARKAQEKLQGSCQPSRHRVQT